AQHTGGAAGVRQLLRREVLPELLPGERGQLVQVCLIAAGPPAPGGDEIAIHLGQRLPAGVIAGRDRAAGEVEAEAVVVRLASAVAGGLLDATTADLVYRHRRQRITLRHRHPRGRAIPAQPPWFETQASRKRPWRLVLDW